METLQALKETGQVPGEMWYLSTLILTGILILFIGVLTYLISGFFKDLKETIKDLKDNLQKLTKMVDIHEVEIENQKSDIAELKKRRR